MELWTNQKESGVLKDLGERVHSNTTSRMGEHELLRRPQSRSLVKTTMLLLSAILISLGLATHAYPGRFTCRVEFKGQKIHIPPQRNDTGLMQIPDAAHPFRAPRPDDERGPCPALNTMANHGYISRNGISSYEEIIEGAMEAFNMERDLAAALVAFGMLARGNPFINRVSIGGPSPLIPALPGKIDGPITRGLATHGRFEGDDSMTRRDFAIGDNRNFQADLYDMLLLYVGRFGDDSPITGNMTIVNVDVMAEFKWARFVMDQKANKQFELHYPRLPLAYGESSFVLNFFANGTDGVLSVSTMGSFFRNQTFPANWHRRPFPASYALIANTTNAIMKPHPVGPGANDANGNYVLDPRPGHCALYTSILENAVPTIYANTSGLLKENIDTLLDGLFLPFANSRFCVKGVPGAPANM